MSEVAILRNVNTIQHKVAEILSKLPKEHTRREAFDAINEAKILDKKNKPIVPSVYYHSVTQLVKPKTGKTLMNELYPNFVPAATPYPRKKEVINREASPDVQKSLAKAVILLNTLSQELAQFLPKRDNAIHASIHSDNRDIGKVFNDLTGKRKSG
jgi:hypothetical protein